MNRKQFALLLFLLIVLGGAAWHVQQSRDHASNAGEQGTGRKLLGDAFPVNDVSAVGITEGTNAVNLLKKDDLWRVRQRDDYPASFSLISEFLLKLADLKVIQTEQVGASQLPRLQLAPPGQGAGSGTIVDLRDKNDKSIGTLTLGKKHARKPAAESQTQFGEDGFADGRYVLLAGDPQTLLLIADPLHTAEAKPENWLDKDFFKVERPKMIAVTFNTASNSWRIQRDTDTGDWKLAGLTPGEKLDDARISGVSSPFSSPSFSDVLPKNSKPSEVGLDKPTVVTVDTFDDLTYTINLGAKSGENYPATIAVVTNFPGERVPAKGEKPEDKTKADKAWVDRQKQLDEKYKQAKRFEGWIYLVPGYNIDPILKDRKDLLAEKKEETKTTDTPAGKNGAATSEKPQSLDDKTEKTSPP